MYPKITVRWQFHKQKSWKLRHNLVYFVKSYQNWQISQLKFKWDDLCIHMILKRRTPNFSLRWFPNMIEELEKNCSHLSIIISEICMQNISFYYSRATKQSIKNVGNCSNGADFCRDSDFYVKYSKKKKIRKKIIKKSNLNLIFQVDYC